MLTVGVLVTEIYTRDSSIESKQRACVYTQRSACETAEIWTSSVDCTSVNELVLLSKMLALEETR